MKTIGIAELKAHLSRELRRVAAGHTVVVTDHARAVALLSPLPKRVPVIRPSDGALILPEVEPLIRSDPLEFLAADRGDR
ncbi:MAG: type II toxin-antitoxin system prevent-host-death family antitoxin [Spirochaetaceae bacterium]|nr:MAG: type II toxin-antitoxin system prevent-host-death family antitoxin [Spirochaetaceae bacterium]